MKKSVLLLAIPAMVVTFTCCKTTSTAPAEDRFAKADANHDEKLSPNEANDYLVNNIFASRDLNHDGALTWDEWNVPGSGRSKERFDSADTNKDGSLSLEEALAYGRKRDAFKKEFHEADANQDGFVTRAEAQAYYASKEGPSR